MIDHAQIAAWLRQAKADLDAGEAPLNGGKECHRRYWLQQACEKGIKALGLLRWTGTPSDEAAFRTQFLHKHSPLKSLEQQTAPPKSLHDMRRVLRGELVKLDGDGLLRKVDMTTPTTDPLDTSYRYPFRDAAGLYIAPADRTATDWDSYQGNFKGVAAAIRRFLQEVENGFQRSRSPK